MIIAFRTGTFNLGYGYDSSGNGNMTGDANFTYTFDAENRVISVNVAGVYYCYTYDGDGLRVMKAHGSSCSSPSVDALYWRDIAGNTIADSDASGSTSNSSYHEYVFFNGARIARWDTSGNVYYFFADHLGSSRKVVQAGASSPCYDADFYPYGGERAYTTTCTPNYRFTGYERDGESVLSNGEANDYAIARHYSTRLGRFLSADPIGGDVSDPQSLNRYSYVRNGPTILNDPSGMDPCDASEASCGSCFGDPFFCGGNCDPEEAPFFCNAQVVPPLPPGWPGSTEIGPGDPTGSPVAGQTIGCEVGGIPCGLGGCPYGSGSCGGGVYGFISCASGGCPTFPNYQAYLNWLLVLLGPNARIGFPTISGTKQPNVPRSDENCSPYKDGTGAGDILFGICRHFPAPDSWPWTTCMRGKLLQQWEPNANPADVIIRYGLIDHTRDAIACREGQ